MKLPLIAGNWKMNGSRQMVRALVGGLLEGGRFDCEVAVFPPHVYLAAVGKLLAGSAVSLGAQNADWHESGAFTGETSVSMLLDVGCKYCLVGHSERRHLFGESDELVARKFAACIEQSLTPVLCVGETLDERRSGTTLAVVQRQVEAVLAVAGMAGLAKGLIAYEPVWAIGTGESATPEQAEEVHAGLRALLADKDARVAADMRILYGGSVNGSNASGLLVKDNIDGALVGGASLKADEFRAICDAARQAMG